MCTQVFCKICAKKVRMCTMEVNNFWCFTLNALKDWSGNNFFLPRTCPRTFLQCFAFDSCWSKAKNCKNVLGCVLGQKNSYKISETSEILSFHYAHPNFISTDSNRSKELTLMLLEKNFQPIVISAAQKVVILIYITEL